MADYFVWHASAQDDGDATWNSSTLAYLNLDLCLAAVAAGSNVWVAHDHTKTYSVDTTLNNLGTAAAPIIVTCVNRTTGANATTALEKTTTSTEKLEPFEKFVIYRGINFASADYLTNGLDASYEFHDAEFELFNTDDYLGFLVGDADILFADATIKMNFATQFIELGGGVHFNWQGGGLNTGGTAVTKLFNLFGDRGGELTLKGLDLSNVATNIITLPTALSGGIFKVLLAGCKLPSAVPILNSNAFSSPHEVIAHSCDNGNGYYYFEETYLEGQIKQATNCYRTSGSKYDGTNGYSAKMVSNANALDSKRPLKFKLAECWMDANPTITVETITAGITLQDDEFWIEIEYPNSTTKALRDVDRSSRQQVGYSGGSAPGTPANLTTSTEGWTEDLAGEVKQKVAVTISSGATGAHTVWACLAKPSTTVYVDMKPTVA